MVYRGKPSEGCHSCRQRRIKCDKKRPGCTQCARSWQKCPGYRDKLDVLFRDESKAIARKVINRRKQTRTASQTSISDSSDTSLASTSPPPVLSPFPSIILNDCAVACFMHVYIPASHFDYLSRLLQKDDRDSPLAKAACASAVAYFAAEHGDPKLLPAARQQYSEALVLTNQALSTPAEATKDETLAAILLLSLFEAFMHDGRRKFPKNWTAHVEGAAALLQLRGRKQFETEIGSLLFTHVSTNIKVSAAIRRVPLPPDFDDLCVEALKHYHGEDQLWRMEFLRLVEAFARLRFVVDQQLIRDPQELITTLLDLDSKIIENMEKMPASWRYTLSESTEVTPGLWLQPMHYANAKVAQVWDSIRMMRLFLSEATRRILAGETYYGDLASLDLDVSREELSDVTEKTCDTLAREICASIHNYIHKSSSPNRRIALAEASWLLWPLAVAGESMYVAPDVRQYAIDQLQLLGKDARLPQALWAAEMLRERSTDEEWLHIYHVA